MHFLEEVDGVVERIGHVVEVMHFFAKVFFVEEKLKILKKINFKYTLV